MRNLFGGASESDRLARLAGFLYFLVLPTAGYWFYNSTALLGGDAATFAGLEAGRSTLELAIVLGASGHILQFVAAVILHRLLSPFGKVAANSMLGLIAASVPLALAAIAQEMDLLALLDGGSGLKALGPEQLQAQITLTVHAYTSLFNTAALFWGLWLFPLGWLLLRSRLVPRVIGWCVLLGGPMYALSFFGHVLDAGYASSVVAQVVGIVSGIPDLIGELGTAVWLALKGAGTGSAPARATAPAA